MRSAPSTGRVAAATLHPPSLTSVASAWSTAISSSTWPVTQASRNCRTISSDSRRDAVKRGRESRSRPRAREDLPRVRLALADAPRDLVEVELEHLAQQEDGTLGRRQLLQQDEKCRGQRRRQLGGFLIRFRQRFGQPWA